MASGEFLEEHHRVLLSRLASVGREITDNRLRTRDDLEDLYRRIVSYVLLRSGLGSPTDINTVREATGELVQNLYACCFGQLFPQTSAGRQSDYPTANNMN